MNTYIDDAKAPNITLGALLCKIKTILTILKPLEMRGKNTK